MGTSPIISSQNRIYKMARNTITTKVEVKTSGFVPEWPKELDLKPLYSVQVSPKHRADVYFDAEIPQSGDRNNNPYIIYFYPATNRAYSGRQYRTLLQVRLALDEAVADLNKKSTKRTQIEDESDDD